MITIYEHLETREGGVVYSYDELYGATFKPSDYDLLILDGAHGKTYRERKASIEGQAVAYSNMSDIVMSCSDLLAITDYFALYGKRYGLLTDFHANCVC